MSSSSGVKERKNGSKAISHLAEKLVERILKRLSTDFKRFLMSVFFISSSTFKLYDLSLKGILTPKWNFNG